MTDRFELADVASVAISVGDVGGDLRVRGWRRKMAAVDAGGATGTPALGDSLLLVPACSGDCKLRVPEGSRIEAASIGGDFELAGVSGSCSVESVAGDVTIRKCGPVSIKSVGGDLKVKRVIGRLEIGEIGGDATLRQISGLIEIGTIGGDVYIRRMGSSGRVGAIGGDLILDTDFQAGAIYEFKVGGDLVCRVPPNAGVCFLLPVGVELRMDAEPNSREEKDGRLLVKFGNGDATVRIDVGGSVRLLQWGVSSRGRRYSRWTRPGGWTEEHGGWQVSWGTPRMARPADEPVTEDERLIILRMLESEQITVEEAERLLGALEE